MNSAINHPAKILATGFIILVFLSLPLFWVRFICETSITVGMPGEATYVRIEPSGLVPPEIENDPNVVRHSRVSANIHLEAPLAVVGIADYFRARSAGERHSNVYLLEGNEWIYFDKKSGLLVCQHSVIQVMPDKSTRTVDVEIYIGPEGIAQTPDKTLGRFTEPIIYGTWNYRMGGIPRELIVYDKHLRRFFRVDSGKKSVVKGPELAKDDSHNPIQIDRLKKNFSQSESFYLQMPRVKVANEDPNDYRMRADDEPIIPEFISRGAGPYLPVLDRSSRIDLLDKKTLEFAGTAGWLPTPETYFGAEPSFATPKDLLDYEIRPLALSRFYREDGKLLGMAFGEPEPHEMEALDASPSSRRARQTQVSYLDSKVEREYLGIVVTGTSRDGTAMVLAVFDAQGKPIKTEYTRLPIHEGLRTSYLQSSKVAYWEAPWAPVSTIGKYLAENLHPPVLSLASYFTASAFEAGSGHRALFLLPNSFVAMVARDSEGNFAERLFSALGLMLPSIVLAIGLAGRVGKNAAVVGLSRNVRRYWIAGTIAFGLAGYITYRLSRPKVTLVTCANCGHPRRPDMDKCHRCGSPWHVPDLTPPAWRVLDGDVTERESG